MKTVLSSSGDVSVQGKGMTQFLVGGDGEEWTVKPETQALDVTRIELVACPNALSFVVVSIPALRLLI